MISLKLDAIMPRAVMMVTHGNRGMEVILRNRGLLNQRENNSKC